MITCLLTCQQCGLVDAEVKVEARPEGMEIVEWMETVLKPTVSRFHSTHSLLCDATSMTGLKIPMDHSPGAWIGKQTDAIPPKGPFPTTETPHEGDAMSAESLVIDEVRFQKFGELPAECRALLMDGMKAVVDVGGNLNLTDYHEYFFAFAHIGGAPSSPIGFLTVADNPSDDGKWIQAAYTAPQYRGRGVFRALADAVARCYPRKTIGIGTNGGNCPMIDAATAAGFRDVKMYCYRRPS